MVNARRGGPLSPALDSQISARCVERAACCTRRSCLRNSHSGEDYKRSILPTMMPHCEEGTAVCAHGKAHNIRLLRRSRCKSFQSTSQRTDSQYEEEEEEQECNAACQYICPVNFPAKCPGKHRTFVPFEFKIKYNVPIQPGSHLLRSFTIYYPINVHCKLMYAILA